MKENLIEGLRNFMKKRGFTKAVVGLSGGIDSSVCLALSVEALGKENVTAIFMPEENITSEQSKEDAYLLAEKLDVKIHSIPINPLLEATSLPWKQNDLAITNLKPRMRMMMLYNYANVHNAIVIGTSNKSEILLGYGTKFGDTASDVLLIGDLLKTEVYELATELNIPQPIIDKAPSAELMKNQTDENDLGISYEEADKILELYEKGKTEEELLQMFDKKNVSLVLTRIRQNEHKRQPIPVLKK